MSENAMNKYTKTNWELLDTMSDDQIDTSDIPQLTEEFFATAQWRMPNHKVAVTVEVEPEVAAWFMAQGANSERFLAAALSIYAKAHQPPEKAEAA